MLYKGTRYSWRSWPHFLLILLCSISLNCSRHNTSDSAPLILAFDVLQAWNKQLLVLDQFSEGYRPPVSARMFAYAGIGAWQSSLPAFEDAISLVKHYPNLQQPAWNAEQPFVLAAALNGMYTTFASVFFPHAPSNIIEQSAQLQQMLAFRIKGQFPLEAIEASFQFGKTVAECVYNWSANDAVGHMAFLYNYDKNYELPLQNGRWQPNSEDHLPPLLPHWGEARTFVQNESIEGIAPITFSEDHGSAFFADALEVYSLSQPITDESRWIAEFWSDDFPGVTFSASSRWISICLQALEKAKPPFSTALAVYLKTGLALNDAGVHTWRFKYKYIIERPISYIQRNIQKNWIPLHQTPPFPSYPSGHATFGAAAAAVLTRELGEKFHLTDKSHQGRKEFNGAPRSFTSFAEMANENALSRILLGVHFRMDCEEGLRLGHLIGEKVGEMNIWDKGHFVKK